jgi:hypothetical protein
MNLAHDAVRRDGVVVAGAGQAGGYVDGILHALGG